MTCLTVLFVCLYICLFINTAELMGPSTLLSSLVFSSLDPMQWHNPWPEGFHLGSTTTGPTNTNHKLHALQLAYLNIPRSLVTKCWLWEGRTLVTPCHYSLLSLHTSLRSKPSTRGGLYPLPCTRCLGLQAQAFCWYYFGLWERWTASIVVTF